MGELVVVCPNDGTPALAEGSSSGVAWPADALRPLAADANEAGDAADAGGPSRGAQA
jgi:hypothetical protein